MDEGASVDQLSHPPTIRPHDPQHLQIMIKLNKNERKHVEAKATRQPAIH